MPRTTQDDLRILADRMEATRRAGVLLDAHAGGKAYRCADSGTLISPRLRAGRLELWARGYLRGARDERAADGPAG